MGATVLEDTVDMDMEVMTVMDLEGMMILMAMMRIMKMVTIAVIILYHSHVLYRKVQAISVHPKTFMEIPSKLRSRLLDGSMMITLENVSHLFIQVVVEMTTCINKWLTFSSVIIIEPSNKRLLSLDGISMNVFG